MKKIYLITLLSFAFDTSRAQTIEQSDLPFAGLAWTSGVDTTYNDAIPAGGAAQSWDFSSLQYDYVDTSGFGEAAGTPYANAFPDANLAAHKVSTNEWSYFSATSTGLYVEGYVNDSITLDFNPRQMYVPVPFSYGNTHTDISRIVIDTVFLTYDARVIINFQGDFHAEGSGSLITPTATYPSTLRVKQTLLQTDSLMVDYTGTGNYVLLGSQQTQQTFFRWYQHGGTANYILGLDADSLGNFANRSDYVLQWAVLDVSTVENSDSPIVYPNPTTHEVKIYPGNKAYHQFLLYDYTGKLVRSIELNSEKILDVSTLPAGIYFYSVSAADKQVNGKLNIMH